MKTFLLSMGGAALELKWIILAIVVGLVIAYIGDRRAAGD